jgi:hypothetical protein
VFVGVAETVAVGDNDGVAEAAGDVSVVPAGVAVGWPPPPEHDTSSNTAAIAGTTARRMR